MAVKWKSSKHPGVRFYEHPTRKNGINKDRYFAIRYQLNGKRLEEGLGWASEGWTAEKAAIERSQLKKAHITGEGAVSLQEKRDLEAVRREQEQKEKELFEKQNITFKTFFEEIYKPIARTNKKPESYRKEKEHFNNWLNPVLGKTALPQISPFHIEKIKKNMLDAGRAPRTVQYCLAIFRQVWNLAKREGYVREETPTKQVKIPKIDNERKRFLTHEEADTLLEYIKGQSLQLYRMSLISLHCGLRAGEIFNLAFGDIDIERGLLTLRDTKGGDDRTAFMTENVKKMFLEIEPGNKTEYIFKDRNGKKIKSVSNAFDRAVDKCGLNAGFEDRKHRKQRVVFHTLRHTFASWLAENGIDLYTIQKLMGHSSFEMVQRYAHLGENSLQAAVKKLEESINGNKSADVIQLKK